MDWFKVRVNHVFYDGLNRTEGWAWIKVMALTAQLEQLPNEKQLLSVITKRELKLLTNWCETISKPLTNLLESVLKDAATLEKNREKLKNFRHNSAKKRENVTVSVPISVTDKRIREDKIYIADFDKLWDQYPRREGKKAAQKSYISAIKAGHNYQEVEMSLQNYLKIIKENNTDKKFIKHGSTFFNNWEDYKTIIQVRHPEEIEYEKQRQEYINKQKG